MNADELKRLYPRVLAKTIALTRNLPDAEDAVQTAIERALATWQATEPDSLEAWLVTTAGNAFRDKLRRRRREDLRADPRPDVSEQASSPIAELARGWKDELLRLLFACCHPALDEGESAALALSTILGLTVNEIAAAFVVAPRTMEQRLTRARQRLRERGDYDGDRPESSRARVPAALRSIHLLFNEGYWSTGDAEPIRARLCQLAIGLSRSLGDAFPGEPEALGLLSLLRLHDARREARFDERGDPVPLPEQDRTRWDRRAIADATRLLETTLAGGRPGPYQVEAAIAAVHCRATRACDTDWAEIAALYALLERLRPNPAVRVNRAFAVARARGAAAGLDLLDCAADGIEVTSYPYAHLVRGTLLAEVGRVDEARGELEQAAHVARNARERAQIQTRLVALDCVSEGRHGP
jgi:RNA polymerase sigma-70 factor (ECF subfamily)